MENLPFVSVIIPTYNREPLLKKTLTSLKSVDYPKNKIEIIVVNNGSNDKTPQMVKSFFPNIKLFSFSKNEGIPIALNLAIKKSKGKYIFQTNDDVVFAKNSLKILVEAAEKDPKTGIAGGRLYFSDRPKTPMITHLKVNLFIGYHSFRQTPSDRISEVDIVTGASMLIKRDVIDKIGLTDEKFGPYGAEDYEFCFRTKASGFKIIFCPRSLVWVKEFKTKDKKINNQRLFDHYKGKFRFMLLYANPLQNLVFFPTQLLFAPIFCYLQSRKKIFFPMSKALLWNFKNLKQTLQARSQIRILKKTNNDKSLLLKKSAPFLIILLIAILGQVPLFSLLASPPAGYTALGGSPLLSPSDTNVYMGAMKEGQLGHWLYANNYTTIDNARVLIFSLYIFLGHVSKWTQIPPPILFILAQFFSSILLLSSIWLLGSSFFSDKKQKVLYFFVALFVTGYGWVTLLLINSIPFLNFAKGICSGRCFSIDFWTHDATVFPLLSTVPHITLTAALMVFYILITANYLLSKDKKSTFFIIILPTLIGLLSSYHLLIIITFNCLIIMANFKKIKKYKALIFSTILAISRALYLLIVLNSNPSFSNWINSSPLYSPPFPAFLIGWGGLLLTGYFGFSQLPKTKLSQLVKIIAGLTIFFAFLPTNISRNFVLTAPIFLAIFTTFGLVSLSFKKSFSKIIVLFVILATIDSFFIYTSSLSVKKQLENDPSFALFFISNEEKEGLDWLRANSNENEGIMTTYRLGDIIPPYTGNKVFWGHWSLSGKSENQFRYEWVIETKNPDEVLGFLKNNNLKWLITLSNTNPRQRYLKQKFSNSTLSIYKIETP